MILFIYLQISVASLELGQPHLGTLALYSFFQQMLAGTCFHTLLSINQFVGAWKIFRKPVWIQVWHLAVKKRREVICQGGTATGSGLYRWAGHYNTNPRSYCFQCFLQWQANSHWTMKSFSISHSDVVRQRLWCYSFLCAWRLKSDDKTEMTSCSEGIVKIWTRKKKRSLVRRGSSDMRATR